MQDRCGIDVRSIPDEIQADEGVWCAWEKTGMCVVCAASTVYLGGLDIETLDNTNCITAMDIAYLVFSYPNPDH